MNPLYESYAHWRDALTEKTKLTLDAAYCRARVEALSDEGDPSTRALLEAYGTAHRDQILRWFEQALAES